MATRFDAYRMQDGKTPLSADYFNPVFQDIDLRISDLEQRRTDLQSVIDELSKFGLQRIDTLTTRAMTDMDAVLLELREVRDELTSGTQLSAAMQAEAAARTAGLAGLAAVIENEKAERGQAITEAVQAEAAARTAGLAGLAAVIENEKAERGQAITAAIEAEAAARTESVAQEAANRAAAIAQATAKPSAATITYDGAGRVSGTTETLPDGERVTTLTYGDGGRVDTVGVVMAGNTRTTTYAYDGDGRVGGYAVVEA